MNFLSITLDEAWTMARRHGCVNITSSDFDEDMIPVWASNNYRGCIGAPGDVDELYGHVCYCVGAYTKGVISKEIYLRAMENIDNKLRRHYGTSIENEWLC